MNKQLKDPNIRKNKFLDIVVLYIPNISKNNLFKFEFVYPYNMNLSLTNYTTSELLITKVYTILLVQKESYVENQVCE